ncbi:hypothetical protein [Actinacidiphila soli]|uniref:hypothetical protein n=1 Tax=Actinacidiphila soli TaxID=2487275 RepID=UPI000FCB3B10|nr:hypothetical protein [Actinacidiphila soli]
MDPQAPQQLAATVAALRSATLGMSPAAARRFAVGYVSVLVVQLSITHPELAQLVSDNTGFNALMCAAAAGKATGKVWDRLQTTGDTDPPEQ